MSRAFSSTTSGEPYASHEADGIFESRKATSRSGSSSVSAAFAVVLRSSTKSAGAWPKAGTAQTNGEVSDIAIKKRIIEPPTHGCPLRSGMAAAAGRYILPRGKPAQYEYEAFSQIVYRGCHGEASCSQDLAACGHIGRQECGCVDLIITDKAVFEVDRLQGGLKLVECAPGITVSHLQETTGAYFSVAESLAD